MSNLRYLYLPQQVSCRVEHRKETVAASADFVDYLTKLHVGTHGIEVAVYHAVETHQCEYGVVGMVGDQLSLLCQTHTVDAVRLKHIYGEI